MSEVASHWAQLSPDGNEHFSKLRDAYRAVGERTWLATDFSDRDLDASRQLFTPESLQTRRPRPNALEVYALLSGVAFSQDFADRLVAVQRRISEVLGDCLHYWVAAENLGVEYCVFKWPKDVWDPRWGNTIDKALAALPTQAFQFHVKGVQINPDGCVVARGFDEHSEIFRARRLLRTALPFLPEKQSGWAHVPLGRILEPVGTERFTKLGHLMAELADESIASTRLDLMKFVHETRWYMEERETIAEYQLGERASQGGS